ncbi:MAG: hypothetical protein Q7T97_02415 [Burkholderiaceae bacterium]|nr:hypothetical protein [Burkholderiaceae bacterium]
MYRLKKLPNIVRKVESFWGIHERDCAEVETSTGRYIAVKATGTLFRMDGECVASSFLRMLP